MSQTKINGVKIDVRLLNQALALKLEEALSELHSSEQNRKNNHWSLVLLKYISQLYINSSNATASSFTQIPPLVNEYSIVDLFVLSSFFF
jgi:hypothetical protein